MSQSRLASLTADSESLSQALAEAEGRLEAAGAEAAEAEVGWRRGWGVDSSVIVHVGRSSPNPPFLWPQLLRRDVARLESEARGLEAARKDAERSLEDAKTRLDKARRAGLSSSTAVTDLRKPRR